MSDGPSAIRSGGEAKVREEAEACGRLRVSGGDEGRRWRRDDDLMNWEEVERSVRQRDDQDISEMERKEGGLTSPGAFCEGNISCAEKKKHGESKRNIQAASTWRKRVGVCVCSA